jgi:hypothetical protein
MVEMNMMKKPPETPPADGIAIDNVVPFPARPKSDTDEDSYKILSVLLANEFEKFKGPLLL